MILLGVNIDHVATVRNARGGNEPDPIEAAKVAEANGADGITAHLREDRRHIRDEDIRTLKRIVTTRLNLEMAATEEMLAIACEVQPYMATLVPERREEITTEGGLDVVRLEAALTKATQQLKAAGILVSLFIAPTAEQVQASQRIGADFVEFHTGEYAHAWQLGEAQAQPHLQHLLDSAQLAVSLGVRVNAGHGLTYDNVKPILALPGLEELNIGHSIIARSIFDGLGPAVAQMKVLLTTSL